MTKHHTKDPDRRSIGYSILRKYVCFALTKVFYRRYTVTSDQKIPQNVPVVFGANHQNALIDALAIICASSRHPVFFARADIFKKKLLKKILYFLRIAPLFRIRDGRDTLHQNVESFDLATRILSRNHTIGIFPEGTHNDKEHIIPLKKGMGRMVLQAEELHNFELNVHVVPVSISYVDYIKPRSEVRIHLGTPLTFAHYKDLYTTNPSQALVKFNEEFDEALKSIAMHVDNEESYLMIQNLRKSLIYDKLGARAKLRDSFNAAHTFVGKMNKLVKEEPLKSNELFSISEKYFSLLESNGITEPVLFRGGISVITSSLVFLLLLLGMPIYVLGRILNYFPFLFLYRFVNKKIKDTQFRSSVYFALTALFVAPLMYIMQAVIVGLMSSSFLIGLASLPLMILIGIGAYQYLRFWKWSMMRWKANIFVRRHPDDLKQLTDLRGEMINKLNDLIKE